jgi:prepilin-type N-terminal cleavage/methylation domain-containing protein/prepilin-type processing-associated H-X9-DG protein
MNSRYAFTLIELLVVIAILGVLASLLLPALSRAKLKAQQTNCLINLQQLQVGWLMYVHEQNDTLPLNAQETTSYSGNASTTNSWVVGDATYSADSSYIRQGTLYPYVGHPGVYHCPSDRSLINGSGVRRARSYSVDYYLNGAIDPQYSQYLPGDTASTVVVKYAAIYHPSRVFAFLDENANTIEDGVFLLYRNPDETWQNAPSDRHTQGLNLSFTDGHCEHWKWRYPKQMQGLAEGVASDDDLKDLRRLQSALPIAP